jgi:hypothetical protein
MTAEQEARQLRDSIYGLITDKEWLVCRDKWVDDLEWLRANAPQTP